MDRLPYLLLIFGAGLCWPMQAAVNAELKARVDQPLVPVIVNGGGGAILAALILLTIAFASSRLTLPTTAQLSAIPWWACVGGVFSVVIIVAQASSARPLGAALMVVAFLAGQVLSGAVFDQLGLMNYPVKQISPMRVLGIGSVLVGLVLLFVDASHRPPEPAQDRPRACTIADPSSRFGTAHQSSSATRRTGRHQGNRSWKPDESA